MIDKKAYLSVFIFALISGSLLFSVKAATIPAGSTGSEITQTKYRVVHVDKNDHLNMRAGAGVTNDVVTTIPYDVQGIESLGDEALVGKTRWVLIRWNGMTGWVSQYYLQAMPDVVVDEMTPEQTAEKATKNDQVVAVSKEVAPDKTETRGTDTVSLQTTETDAVTIANRNTKNRVSSVNEETGPAVSGVTVEEEWVLQCGNKSPFWQVQVHPEWMTVIKGDYETELPITAKKQDKNRWNTALKTVVQGKKGRNHMKMTIKYAYSRRCYDTLSGLRVPYKVTTDFNGEELTGCCRAVKLEKSLPEDTKISLK